MVFECEGSSVRARARWSASSRAFECEGSRAISRSQAARGIRKLAAGTLLLQYILNYLC